MEREQQKQLTQAGLIEKLHALGYADVTTRRVADWRLNELLPPFDIVGSGRGRRSGRECSVWTNGQDILDEAKQVYELLKTHDAFIDVYVPLWILGFPVPLSRIRQGLKRPLEVTSNDVAVEVDGRNAIEDTIDDAAYEFTRVIKLNNMEPFDVPQETLAAFMNILLNTAYDLHDQPFQDGVEALRGWEQNFQTKLLDALDHQKPPEKRIVNNGLTVFTHAAFVNQYLSVPHLREVVETCGDEDLLAVSRDLEIGREIVLELRRLLTVLIPYFPDQMKPTWSEELTTILSVGKICVWADLAFRRKGHGELIENILRLMLDEIRKQFDEKLMSELSEIGPQITLVMNTLIDQLGPSLARSDGVSSTTINAP